MLTDVARTSGKRASGVPDDSRPALLMAPGPEPWRLVRYALTDWAIIVGCWIVMLGLPHPLTYVAGVLIIGGRFHALGVILHDACHMPLRRRSPARWLTAAIAGWPIGSTIEAMRYHHLRHHRATCAHEDPYLHRWATRGFWMRRLLMFRGAFLPLLWSLRAAAAPLALCWPGLRTWYARVFLQDRSGKDLSHHPEVVRCARMDLAQLAAHLLAAAVIIRWQLPFVPLYLVPWVIGGILNANRVLIEHEHAQTTDRSSAAVWSRTYTHDFGWAGRLFLFPRNIGFHQAHHACPGAALEHLPALHRALTTPGVKSQSASRAYRAPPEAAARQPG